MPRPLSKRFCRLPAALLIVLFFSTATTAAPLLPASGAQADQSSVSGISSGGFMATQFHVAYSARLVGAGIVAGGPYFCAGSDTPANALSSQPYLSTATTTCMNPCRWAFWPFIEWCEQAMLPDGKELAARAQQFAEEGKIDPLEQLSRDRLYLFSGGEDDTVVRAVVDQALAFYRAVGIADTAILFDQVASAQHAFIATSASNRCDYHGSPYINRCGDYDQARTLLQRLYGALEPNNPDPRGELLTFDQREFVATADFERSGLADQGYLYRPQSCSSEPCRVHVALHGCQQSAEEFATNKVYFHQLAGYNEVADNNRIIVLYPQIRARSAMQQSPYNPRGCWDFWGYSGSDFYTKTGVQMQAIAQMIDRLMQPR
ncbi:MAG TPA: hypothetical protein VIS52_00460 [Motiliproteus sp.]